MRGRAVLAKKQQMVSDEVDDEACSNERPLIEVRISSSDILLRVFCDKRKGVLSKIITTMERLKGSVVNVNYVPFGDAYVDINIIAELEADCTITLDEIKEALQSTLQANE